LQLRENAFIGEVGNEDFWQWTEKKIFECNENFNMELLKKENIPYIDIVYQVYTKPVTYKYIGTNESYKCHFHTASYLVFFLL